MLFVSVIVTVKVAATGPASAPSVFAVKLTVAVSLLVMLALSGEPATVT